MILTRRHIIRAGLVGLFIPLAPALVRAAPLVADSRSRPGLPVINWSHPACSHLQFSFVAGGKVGGTDLAKKQDGTVSGAVTGTTKAFLGTTLTFATTNHVDFASRAVAQENNATIWALLSFGAPATNQDIFTSSTGSSGVGLALIGSNGTVTFYMIAVTGLSSAIAVSATAGVPYLIIASLVGGNGGSVNFLIKQLDTGAYSTATISVGANTPIAPNGTYILGSDAFNIGASNASIAALAYSLVGLSPAAILRASADPWGPWRPNPGLPIDQMVAATAPTVTVGHRALKGVGK